MPSATRARTVRGRQDFAGAPQGRPSPKRTSASRGYASDAVRRTGWEDEPEEGDFEETRPSKLEKLKRSAAKNKAGKAFTRQFGSGDSDAATSGGSRAALYKGEMGKRHKQAARMQGNPGEAMGASKKRLSGIGSNARSPKLLVGMAVVACLVLSCVFLYPTARQYYVTVRQHDQLQAEYAALQQRNEAIRSEVDNLSTNAGIEDRARKEFGWVKEGENAVNVYGIDSSGDESAYNKAITPGSVEAPETWYSPVLDVVFGVE